MKKSLFFIFALIFSFPGNLLSAEETIVINEIMPSNFLTLYDEDYDSSDWIELYNSSASPVNLKGFKISNTTDAQNAFVLPDTVLSAHSYVLIFASGKNRSGAGKYALHALGNGTIAETDRDSFHYLYTEIEGDFEIETHVSSINNYGDDNVCGLILRDGLDPSAAFAGMFVSSPKEHRFNIIDRTESGRQSQKRKIRDCWYPEGKMKLIRRADTVFACTWAGGYYWSEDKSVYFPQTGKLLLGLAYSGAETHWTVDGVRLNGSALSLGNMNRADINAEGSGQVLSSNEIHADFKLSKQGGQIYLWNSAGDLVDELSYESQLTDVSFGLSGLKLARLMYFEIPSPGAVNVSAKLRFNPKPTFSRASGFYEGTISVEILAEAENDTIYYTLNGSIPTSKSKVYDGTPIEINQTTTIRALRIAPVKAKNIPSTATYFIDEDFDLPVFAVTADSAGLWDEENGVYNPVIQTKQEIPCRFEFWDNNLEYAYGSEAGLRIHGAGSRSFGQKSIRLYARNAYENSKFDYPFLGDNSFPDFDKIILRNGGQEWVRSVIRDGFLSELIKLVPTLRMSEYRSAVHFLNGEFWGIIGIREKIDEDYVSRLNDIPLESLNYIGGDTLMTCGSRQEFDEMLDYIQKTDLSDDANFAYVDSILDLKNFIDYLTFEIYSANFDWPRNNLRLWNSAANAEKWQWIPYDMDMSYGVGSSSYDWKKFVDARDVDSDVGILMREMFDNQAFKEDFLNRTADLLNTAFLSEHIIPIIDSLADLVLPLIPRQQKKWSGAASDWGRHINDIRVFAEKRPDYYRQNLCEVFGIDSTYELAVNANIENAGSVKVSTILINNMPWSGGYFGEIPVSITAYSASGYKFTGWTGDITSDEKTISVILDRDTELIANFSSTGEAANIVFNELMYNASDEADSKDWVELYNPGNSAVDISYWTFKDEDDNRQYALPAGTEIAGDSYLVLCRDSGAFSEFYDIDNFIGNFDFGLSNDDQIRLYDRSGKLIDSVDYSYIAPWPTDCDGTGRSMELINPFRSNLYGEYWRASAEPYGTPGRQNSIHNSVKSSDPIGNNFSCSPNPASDNTYLNFDLREKSRISASLYNSAGQKIRSVFEGKLFPAGSHSCMIETQNLGGGAYFVLIESDKDSQVLMFVVVR